MNFEMKQYNEVAVVDYKVLADHFHTLNKTQKSLCRDPVTGSQYAPWSTRWCANWWGSPAHCSIGGRWAVAVGTYCWVLWPCWYRLSSLHECSSPRGSGIPHRRTSYKAGSRSSSIAVGTGGHYRCGSKPQDALPVGTGKATPASDHHRARRG